MQRRLVWIAALTLAASSAAGVAADAAGPSARAGPPAPLASGVVLTDQGGMIVAANVDGSGFRVLTHPPVDTWDANPTPSPDGTQIAFTRLGDPDRFDVVELMHADGSGLRALGEGDYAQWSPDGTHLAWAEGRVLAVVGADGTQRRVVVSEVARFGFTWSPDGSSIVYSSPQGISVVNVASGARAVLLRKDQAWRPAWSPDGAHIAFKAPSSSGRGERVFVMNADGGGAHPIGPEPRSEETPAWSPDGTQVAFGVFTFPKPGPLVLVDISTGRVSVTIPATAGGESAVASWSPDGTRIAFMRGSQAGWDADNGGDIWIANADGTHAAQATRNFPFGGAQSRPQWVPGEAAVVPDPPVPAVALHAAASKLVGDEYLLAAVDGPAAAFVRDADSSTGGHGSSLGIWRGRGPVSWVHATCANRVALTGSRVYWSCYWSDHAGSDTQLWTATLPGGKPVRLAHVAGEPGAPALDVQGDHSLVVYTFGGSLWRLQGRAADLIRKEHGDIYPLFVDRGRVLLVTERGTLELVNGRGRLIASLPGHRADTWDCLVGNTVIALQDSRIRVYTLPSGSLRATFPVGPTGLASRAGFPDGSLFPYRTATGYNEALDRIVDVTTGRDTAITVGDGVSPTTAGVTSTGLFYTATPLYSRAYGEIGFVPLAALRTALG